MPPVYYPREIEPRLKTLASQFPVVLVTGPRQSGKSTLLQHTFPTYAYQTLDDPAIRALAIQDPALFLSRHTPPLIIDEIQYAPDLLTYLKLHVDQRRGTHGHYLLTGSQVFGLMHGVSESLAGRIAICDLYPFSWKELQAVPGYADLTRDELLFAQMVNGFYPEQWATPGLDIETWYASYVNTYLERDVRNIKRVSDLSTFQTFLRLLAARAGRLLNLSEVAKECGITQPTAKAWVSILEATYIVFLLKPFHANTTKRLIKSPKVYFVDTGLLCYLLGIDTPARLMKAADNGAVFENMVVMDMLKRTATMKGQFRFSFYRTAGGQEVDLILEHSRKRVAFEVKLSKSIIPRFASGIQGFANDHRLHRGHILCLRDSMLPLSKTIDARHWSEHLHDWTEP